jgi:hypothetical protein
MANYIAKQIIGKHLYAKNDLTAYEGYPLSKNTFKIFSGQDIGLVFSYLTNTSDGKLYWMFYDENKKPYYVAQGTNIELGVFDKKTIPSQEQLADDVLKQKEIEDKGSFIYYAEKWGGRVLLLTGIAVIGVAAIKNRK